MVYAVGAGPLQKSAAQKAVRECLESASVVTVRERRALQVLEEIGVKREIRVTADPAFLLEPEPLAPEALQREGLDGDKRTIGISVREPGVAAPDIDVTHYHALLANAADYMIDRLDADLVFVPMERNVRDLQQSHQVISQMAYPNRAHVLKGEYTPGQILSLVGQFAFAVGMRMHFLLFAALQGVPFVALPYAGKVLGLLETLEIAMPPMQEVKVGQLIAHIDRSWDMREGIRERATRAVPLLQSRARENNAAAVALLGAADGPPAAAGNA
jgi:polysaccharide pyruvyl transferase WcaK-like protein